MFIGRALQPGGALAELGADVALVVVDQLDRVGVLDPAPEERAVLQQAEAQLIHTGQPLGRLLARVVDVEQPLQSQIGPLKVALPPVLAPGEVGAEEVLGRVEYAGPGQSPPQPSQDVPGHRRPEVGQVKQRVGRLQGSFFRFLADLLQALVQLG